MLFRDEKQKASLGFFISCFLPVPEVFHVLELSVVWIVLPCLAQSWYLLENPQLSLHIFFSHSCCSFLLGLQSVWDRSLVVTSEFTDVFVFSCACFGNSGNKGFMTNLRSHMLRKLREQRLYD